MKTILKVFQWVLGLAAFYNSVVTFSSDYLRAIFYLCIGLILFPPFNDLIVKFNYAKAIKALVVLGIITTVGISIYLDEQPSAEKTNDKNIKGNVQLIHILAKEWCQTNKKCAISLDEIYSSGKAAPFTNYKVEDYYYKSIDNGKDCIISAKLSTGKMANELCIGEDLKYIKYLNNPYSN